MSELDKPTTLEEELHALAAPIRERLQRVEAELQEAQAAVERLRADRSKVRAALRAVDPTYQHPNAPGPKSKRRNGGPPSHTWSEDAVEKAAAAIEAARGDLEGEEFTAAQVSRREGWPFSSSYTAVLFSVLHERRVLRLDRTGKGGSKLYRLV